MSSVSLHESAAGLRFSVLYLSVVSLLSFLNATELGLAAEMGNRFGNNQGVWLMF
jgi:hypothetical protein